MNRFELKGIFPPIPTPFDKDGNILHEELRANLARWFETGLHGVVVLGSNGEYVMLNEEEKYAVWETAREAIPTDRVFIAGAGTDSTRAALTLTRRAAAIGADAVMIVTPHYYRAQMNSAALLRHYRSLADASPIPIILYNVPQNTNVDMDALTILELAQHENIIGIKDSSGNLAKMGEVIRSAPLRFSFLSGSGSYLYPALAIGARGAVPALANVAPHECVQLYDLFNQGEHDDARELQLKLIRLNATVTTRMGVPGLKAALDELGYYGGPPRPPLLPLGDLDRASLRAILLEAEVMEGIASRTVFGRR